MSQNLKNIEIEVNSINLIRLNRPSTLNSFSVDMISELIDVVKKWKEKEIQKPLVITGNGRAFSSGGDLKMIKDFIDKGKPLNYLEMIVPKVNELIKLIINYQGPTLAILNGSAVGGGLNLALACDFRIVEKKAKFRLGFTDLGLTPATGNSFFLTRILGVSKTLALSLFSEVLTAQDLVDFGIAIEKYDKTDFKLVLEKWKIKLLNLDSWQVKEIRALLYSSLTESLTDHLENEYQTILKSGARNLFRKRVNERWEQIQAKKIK